MRIAHFKLLGYRELFIESHNPDGPNFMLLSSILISDSWRVCESKLDIGGPSYDQPQSS